MSRGCCSLQVSPRSVPGRWSCCPQHSTVASLRDLHSSPPLPAPPRPQPLRTPNSPRATSTMYQGSFRAWPMGQPFIPWQLLVWYPRVVWANQGWGQGQARALLGLLLVLVHRIGTRSLGASPPMPGQCLQQHCACGLIYQSGHVRIYIYVCVYMHVNA